MKYAFMKISDDFRWIKYIKINILSFCHKGKLSLTFHFIMMSVLIHTGVYKVYILCLALIPLFLPPSLSYFLLSSYFFLFPRMF